jgi:hypothetical protein
MSLPSSSNSTGRIQTATAPGFIGKQILKRTTDPDAAHDCRCSAAARCSSSCFRPTLRLFLPAKDSPSRAIALDGSSSGLARLSSQPAQAGRRRAADGPSAGAHPPAFTSSSSAALAVPSGAIGFGLSHMHMHWNRLGTQPSESLAARPARGRQSPSGTEARSGVAGWVYRVAGGVDLEVAPSRCR